MVLTGFDREAEACGLAVRIGQNENPGTSQGIVLMVLNVFEWEADTGRLIVGFGTPEAEPATILISAGFDVEQEAGGLEKEKADTVFMVSTVFVAGIFVDIGKDEAPEVIPANILMVSPVFGEVEAGRFEVEIGKEEKPVALTATMLMVSAGFEPEFDEGRVSAVSVGRNSVAQNLLQGMGTISAPRL